ncbi:glycosyltransferase [Flammeovirga agarivorans]|uniref:Glycosyltransferase family 2 protein n=1 Tax=Flammeovirga agarivorans TaxID=2726742 RepID=A0A7X8SQV3_9BACT|nr:glycosyltransferase [Flammeovirga agarivorans]NLR94582.1 glycosyltransferase family 2 protein [Flammeovirga agarivorans]
MSILLILYIIIGVYLIFYCSYLSFTLIVGTFYKKKVGDSYNTPNDDRWLIFIPAYKADHVLIKSLESINVYAPLVEFKIVVLFQETPEDIIKEANNYEITMLNQSFSSDKGNTYIQALKYFNEWLKKDEMISEYSPTHLVLLDKDNCVGEHFFSELLKFRNVGYEYIQGRRSALNLRESVGHYDEISERLNDVSLRNYKCALGWNPELTGSGFIISMDFFINGIDHLSLNNPGMDKNLFLEWILGDKKPKGIYAREAILYEEKTEDIEVLKQQRSRWFAEQYMTAFQFLPRLLKQIFFKFDIEALDYLISIFRPPRSILMLITPLLSLLELLFFRTYYLFTISFLVLLIGGIVFILGNGLSHSFSSLIIRLPHIIMSNLYSLLSIFSGKAKGNFIHTERNKE